MEGQGVTNYSSVHHQPSYGYSTETTEFDDALIRHGVVTRQQALVAKGATPEQAQALLDQQTQSKKLQQQQLEQQPPWFANHENNSHTNADKSDDDDDDDDDTDDDEDDEFLQRYRQERLQELQQQQQASSLLFSKKQLESPEKQQTSFGQVYTIARSEWTEHVNQASSNGTFVVVCLTSSSSSNGRTDCIERAIHEIAREWRHVKFVAIPYQSAMILNDTSSSSSSSQQQQQQQAVLLEATLPTIFVYQWGTLQHQWLQLPVQITAEHLATLLLERGIGPPSALHNRKQIPPHCVQEGGEDSDNDNDDNDDDDDDDENDD
ncbi:hypothetical protein ACA910_021293 [Epithemia clementina (nom. ined.)]